MSAAKGKKRSKAKAIPLSDFLNEDQDAAPGFSTRHVDWAETMENESIDDRYTLASDVKKMDKVMLPTAPKAARGPDVDMDKIPTTPPFTAYVGNLPYEVNEEDISKFFKKMNLDVTSVRIPREVGERGRMRGFGYAEFPDRKSLIDALSLNNETLKNRSIKVSLATEHVENERGGGAGGGRGGDDRVDRTAGDWRSAPKEESSQQPPYRNDRYEAKPPGRGFDSEPYRPRSNYDRESSGFERNDRAFSSDRDFDRGSGGGGGGGFERRGFGGDRDRGFDSYDRNRGGRDAGGSSFDRRDGGGGNRRDFGSSFHEGGGSERNDYNNFGGGRDRRGGEQGGYNRPDDFGRRGRDNYRDKPASGGDEFSNFRRADGGGGGYNRRGDDFRDNRGTGEDRERRGNFERDGAAAGGGSFTKSSERTYNPAPSEPKERPKLQLKPRSKPSEDSAPSPAKTTSTSAIFGGAKPVDTAAKEMEIELRLAKEREEKAYTLDRDRKDDGPKRGPASESGRSRQSSESGGRNYRSSCSEDDGPPTKPPSGKMGLQRHNSSGNSGSDREREHRPPSGRQSADSNPDYDGNRKKNYRSNGDVKERPIVLPKLADTEPKEASETSKEDL